MAHIHGVVDMDKHFVIDAATREITNQSEKITLMQNDHNSERFTFEIPREIEGHDMSLCNSVQVHYLNIGATASRFETAAQNPGLYDIEDFQISPDDENIVTGSWLISSEATKYEGSLNFIISFRCVAEDGSIEYAWNSAVFDKISIGSGYNHTGIIAGKYADILAQWQARIEALEQDGTGGTGVVTIDIREVDGVLQFVDEAYQDSTGNKFSELCESGVFVRLRLIGSNSYDYYNYCGNMGTSYYFAYFHNGTNNNIEVRRDRIIKRTRKPVLETRTINGKPLESDIELTAKDIGINNKEFLDSLTAEKIVKIVLDALETAEGGSY